MDLLASRSILFIYRVSVDPNMISSFDNRLIKNLTKSVIYQYEGDISVKESVLRVECANTRGGDDTKR